MKKILIAIGVSLLLSSALFAQSSLDALRYSQLTFGGTARSMGAGGAMGALPDFSSLSSNPASVALFQSNQFVFTPGLSSIKSSSTFAGNTQTEVKPNFNINGFGIEWVKKFNPQKTDWRNVNFAFGMNRLYNYNSTQYYNGYNPSSSLLDHFAAVAGSGGNTLPNQVYDQYPFDAGLAYDTYLINPAPGDSTHYTSATLGKGTNQEQTTTTTGAISEYDISFGGNYKDKLYIGATIGIPNIRYTSTTDYIEKDLNGDIPDFQSFSFNNSLTTTGTGINAKFGLVYKINDYLRIGGAIHSPTYYFLTDNYNSYIQSNFKDSSLSESSPNGTYNYNLTTPWRAVGSIAVLFKKYGFISADYEFVDYSSANFSTTAGAASSDQEAFNSTNQTITQNFGPASNIRIGGEFVYDIFRFRLGYDLYGSPYKSSERVSGYDNSSQSYTAGLGISDKGVFLDIAYARTQMGQSLQPYSLDQASGIVVPSIDTKTWYNNFVMTLGFRW